MESYIRKCPQCDCNIFHKTKVECNRSKKLKKLCKKCMHKGKSQKELYGDRYDEIIQKRIESQKLVKHTWHDKIVESRRKNGSYKLTQEHRDKISKNTIFNNRGQNHVRIIKILKDNNITWEEYENKISEYKKYKREVLYWTNQQDINNLPNIDKRGKCGIPNAYQLDHKIDTGCVGGDTINFALNFKTVHTIEKNAENYDTLVNNVNQYSLKNVFIHKGDSTELFDWKTNVLYIDPPWGGPDYKTKKDLDLFMSSKRLDEWIEEILLRKNRPDYIFLKLPQNFNFKRFNFLSNVDSIKPYRIRSYVLVGISVHIPKKLIQNEIV